MAADAMDEEIKRLYTQLIESSDLQHRRQLAVLESRFRGGPAPDVVPEDRDALLTRTARLARRLEKDAEDAEDARKPADRAVDHWPAYQRALRYGRDTALIGDARE